MTINKMAGVRLTPPEMSDLEAELKITGESKSNYFRRLRGLKPLLPKPAPKGNQRAKGNKGRWKKDGK